MKDTFSLKLGKLRSQEKLSDFQGQIRSNTRT